MAGAPVIILFRQALPSFRTAPGCIAGQERISPGCPCTPSRLVRGLQGPAGRESAFLSTVRGKLQAPSRACGARPALSRDSAPRFGDPFVLYPWSFSPRAAGPNPFPLCRRLPLLAVPGSSAFRTSSFAFFLPSLSAPFHVLTFSRFAAAIDQLHAFFPFPGPEWSRASLTRSRRRLTSFFL